MNNATDTISLERAAWITWEVQVRNVSMAQALNIPLYQLLWEGSRLLRYPVLIMRTLRTIRKNKISTLFVQNPSLILSLLAVSIKPLFRLTVIIDAHNGGLYPMSGNSHIMNRLAQYVCKKADCVIVTNDALSNTVKKWGGRPFVVTDPIPDFSAYQNKELEHIKPYVLFVCTWADDEPYMEVIKAAEVIGLETDIYISGNYKKRLADKELSSMPPNVKLLGFVSKDKYIAYFRNAKAILDLTTRNNCLVCGAYEALALERPAIISDTKINKQIFPKGFTYTKNNAHEIALSIQGTLKNIKTLEKGIRETAAIHLQEGQEVNESLKQLVIDLSTDTKQTKHALAPVD